MKKSLSTAVVVIVIVGSAASAPIVFAQTRWGNVAKVGLHPKGGMPHRFRAIDQAKILGISEQELQAELLEGKKFPEIAKDLGLTEEQIKQRKTDVRKNRIQELVTDGKITQTQAEKLLRAEGVRQDRKTTMLTEEAAILGISAEDLKARLLEGKNFEQIGKDLGITPEEMKTRRLDQIKAHIQQLVSDGAITQEQADKRIARLSESKKGWFWFPGKNHQHMKPATP